MKDLKIVHVPTAKISKRKYTLYCNLGCGRITATCDQHFSSELAGALDTPCSVCVTPLEYWNSLKGVKNEKK